MVQVKKVVLIKDFVQAKRNLLKDKIALGDNVFKNFKSNIIGNDKLLIQFETTEELAKYF